MDLRLKNKIALVTGSGKGVGRGIAMELAKEGVNVVLNYFFNQATAEETLRMIRDSGANAALVKADVSTREGAAYLVEETVRQFGGLDIVVPNAAIQVAMDVDEYTEDKYDLVMNTNFMGYVNIIRYALPYLKESGNGRIICISSVHAKRPNDFDPVYSMTKGAIKMLVRETAIELAKYHITCNAILPGGVKIEFKTTVGDSSAHRPETHHKRKREYQSYPLGRDGRPYDMGYMVCFLASGYADHITGTGIRMDGGSMLL